MELISARVKIEVAIPVSCMEGVGGRTPGIAGELISTWLILRTMLCIRSSLWLCGFAAALVAANCMIGSTALGQAASGEAATGCGAYASVALPAEAKESTVPKEFPGCASYRSYRGIDRPVNVSDARACAWRERDAQKAGLGQNQKEPTAWVVGGSLILADIYFNGAGVKRDIPLAMRFACEAEEGMASLAQPDIAKLNGALPAHGPFEFCDYAMTTFSMNFCSGYASEIADDRRSRFYDSLKSSMRPEQRTAFEKLIAAQQAYVEAHASEVYQGGSIRGIRTIGSQSILNEFFHTDLVHFERKRWPVLSVSQITGADALLRGEYEKKLGKLGKQTKEQIEDGEVTADNLSRVEGKWESYRDAWVAFARLRYPSSVAEIRAEITLERYRFLKTIL
jgi:hypothetical protein